MKKERPEQIADALFLIAHANHYMVGLVTTVTPEELGEAQQILISRQNLYGPRSQALQKTYDLALDLCEQEMKKPKDQDRVAFITRGIVR